MDVSADVRAKSRVPFWILFATATLSTFVLGCTNYKTQIVDANAHPGRSIRSQIGSLGKSVGHKLHALKWTNRNEASQGNELVTAMPTGMPRAETISPVLASSSLAQFAPETAGPISLVSATSDQSTFVVNQVGEQQVKSLGDLLVALEATDELDSADVGICRAGATTGADPAILTFDSSKVAALVQAAAPEFPLVKTTYNGRASAMIRQGGVQCAVIVRCDRKRRLAQISLITRRHWGDTTMLPAELTAACDGTLLRCITVAETLTQLYGDSARCPAIDSPDDTSFAQVSEKDDYLVPDNYKRLESKLGTESFANRQRPALIEIPGTEYPGSAVLADARALTTFLLQRNFVQAEEPESEGWIMFSGESLSHGKEIVVNVDLGHGMVPVRFKLPNLE